MKEEQVADSAVFLHLKKKKKYGEGALEHWHLRSDDVAVC